MKKIMFNDKFGLTQAVLEGRKTMTRRFIKCPSNAFGFKVMRNGVGNWFVETCDDDERPIGYIEPAYKVGEVVAIAQAYKDVPPYKGHPECSHHRDLAAGWNNKMFVRSCFMPHFVRFTDIKVERLQDISDQDCMKEGIMEGEFMNTWDRYYYDEWGDLPNHITFKTPREAFASLIDKVGGKGTWNKNSWVFAYSFMLTD